MNFRAKKFQNDNIMIYLGRFRVVVVMRHVVGPSVVVQGHDGPPVVGIVIGLLLAVAVDGTMSLKKLTFARLKLYNDFI